MSITIYEKNLIKKVPIIEKDLRELEFESGLEYIRAKNITLSLILKGTPIHLTNSGTDLAFIKADSVHNIPCDAILDEDTNSFSFGTIKREGVILLSGLIPGQIYYLGEGIIESNFDNISGHLAQKLGKAVAEDQLELEIERPIKVRGV